jgi:hypothetical protein
LTLASGATALGSDAGPPGESQIRMNVAQKL